MAAPVIHTVGAAPGMDYATISGAIAAAGTVAGDIIEVYSTAGNVYAESVTINKVLSVVGMVPNQGLTIAAPAGNGVDVSAIGSVLDNFRVRGSAGFSRAVSVNSIGCSVNRVIATNASVGIQVATSVSLLSNCIAYSCLNAGICSTLNMILYAYCCGAFKNVLGSAWDFISLTVGNLYAVGCLAAGGGRNYTNAHASSAWNVSADLTAPGVGSVTGFNTADFVSWAGNDFRISQAARLTTKARLPGYPQRAIDYTGRRRPVRERVFYAGPYYGFEQPTWGVGELSGVA